MGRTPSGVTSGCEGEEVSLMTQPFQGMRADTAVIGYFLAVKRQEKFEITSVDKTSHFTKKSNVFERKRSYEQ